MPNWREPVIAKSINEMWEMCKDLHPDSLEHTLLDWNILGHYYGFCLHEWAQNDANWEGHPLKAVNDEPLASTFNYFQSSGRGIDTSARTLQKALPSTT